MLGSHISLLFYVLSSRGRGIDVIFSSQSDVSVLFESQILITFFFLSMEGISGLNGEIPMQLVSEYKRCEVFFLLVGKSLENLLGFLSQALPFQGTGVRTGSERKSFPLTCKQHLRVHSH